MNSISPIIRLLTATDNRLLMTKNEYISEIAALAPFFLTKKEISLQLYSDFAAEQLKKASLPEGISITTDYASENLPGNTIAYYRISGIITADNEYRFSSKQFEKDLITAENNPAISAHFVHITSGGGEAWYIDRLAASMRQLQKPIFAFIEKIAGSAAYYIASQARHISASTPFDVIGCMGVMVSFMDLQPMFEKWGIKFIEEYASLSDLKNKKYNDLRAGKPEQFIREELNPLCDRFIADVKFMRPAIAALPEDHPVLRGETFYATEAEAVGLIDSVEPLQDAIQRTANAAAEWSQNQNSRNRAIQYLKQ